MCALDVCIEEWKNDQEFLQYMSELNSYSIEKLRKFYH